VRDRHHLSVLGRFAHGVLDLSERDAEERVVASVGDAFDIALEGVPTSGYVWEVELGDLGSAVELLGRETRPPGPPRAPIAGGRASQVFHFRATAPGEGTLHFRYGRSWEPVPVREHLVRVTVRA
jgi:predicted secreted protein